MATQEAKSEKLDRELNELLQEIRVLLPGVQVLFAFLLTVPFASGFRGLSGAEEGLFLVALTSAAVASVLVIAPTAFHRIRFREHDKEHLIQVSNRLAIAATVFLAISMSSAVYLVTELIYGGLLASLVAAALAGIICVLWYAMPLARRRGD